MATKKAQIEKLAFEKSELERQILELKSSVAEDQIVKDQQKKEGEIELNSLKELHKLKIIEQDLKIKELEESNKQKQAQVDDKEFKKLAAAYREQEDIYKIEADRWFKWLSITAAILLALAIISLAITRNQSWSESAKYYIIDILLFSAVWFCGSQYSNSTKLRYNYANRKTLAQSFSNILNNLGESTEIKDKFIERAADILCAPNPVGDKEPLLSKKVIKDMAEIISIAVKK